MVAVIRILLVLCLLCGQRLLVLTAQEPPQPTPGPDVNATFFSGTVSDFSSGRLTVSRNHLGKNESRSFVITQDTKVEGRLRKDARVTVRFRASEEGDVALHIIVRNNSQAARHAG